MTVLARERAYAKVNLCLYLGPARSSDGRHELVTVFDSIDLADALIVEADGDGDTVVCDGVTGVNLVAGALAGLREAGWAAPPVRVEIAKRIPVAAGMGGGSADAAAMLRCAPRIAPVHADRLGAIAAGLGADVPAQLSPGSSLGTGAGEIVEPLSGLPDYGVLVLPQPFALSTADVYREADRLGLARTEEALARAHEELARALPGAIPAVNDLQAAALSLWPEIAGTLDAVRDAGARAAMVCGSGPTVIGLFHSVDAARRAARSLPGAIAAAPVRAGAGARAANE